MTSSRSSSKRSHGPMSVEEDTSKALQVGGSSFGKPAAALEQEPEPEAENKAKKSAAVAMPSFLCLKEIEIKDKYVELNRLENERMFSGHAGAESFSRLPADPALDRYNNIHPWAENRIKLQVPEGCNDYINASPIKLTSTSGKQSGLEPGVQDKYICMQGPKKTTVDHVWHMIWHEIATPYNSSPAVILMLSPTHVPMLDGPSRMFEKCYAYYPIDEQSADLRINETNELGEEFKATIRFVSREPNIPRTPIEVRKLVMTVDGVKDEEKPIWHYLYPTWPDFGALAEENVASILALMEISRKENGMGENPRVIHCSAGVGRTGTFVALEFLIGELQGGAWDEWDTSDHTVSDPVYETVNQLRMQRKTMVQAYEQYAFLYEVLRSMWEGKYSSDNIGGEHQHPQNFTDRIHATTINPYGTEERL